jgi:hypothetical protein
MLELTASTCEVCDGFQFTDTTGLYDAVDNPTGYGGFNGVTGPFDFDTYSLQVWFPSSDTTGAADYTYDLLTLPQPQPDADDHYTWSFTKAMLGLDNMTSGVWTFTATGTKGAAVYVVDVQCIFVLDINGRLSAKLKDYDPECGCKKGCEDPLELFVQMTTVACGGTCDLADAQYIIDDTYQRVTQCC